MKNLTIIFDFDGTIADTYHYIIDISNRIAPKFNYDLINLNTTDKLRNKTAKEVVKFLKIPILKIPAILIKAKKEFNKDIGNIKPIEGIADALKKLQNSGIKIGILSSNSIENIHQFLDDHHLHFFDFIHTTPLIWTKNTSLKQLMKRQDLHKDSIIYIGDETRDIDAGRWLGVKAAAVTWGFNSKVTLKKSKPDFLFEDPKELLELVK